MYIDDALVFIFFILFVYMVMEVCFKIRGGQSKK